MSRWNYLGFYREDLIAGYIYNGYTKVSQVSRSTAAVATFSLVIGATTSSTQSYQGIIGEVAIMAREQVDEFKSPATYYEHMYRGLQFTKSRNRYIYHILGEYTGIDSHVQAVYGYQPDIILKNVDPQTSF